MHPLRFFLAVQSLLDELWISRPVQFFAHYLPSEFFGMARQGSRGEMQSDLEMGREALVEENPDTLRSNI